MINKILCTWCSLIEDLRNKDLGQCCSAISLLNGLMFFSLHGYSPKLWLLKARLLVCVMNLHRMAEVHVCNVLSARSQ